MKENLTQYSQLEEERFELQGELVLIGQNIFLAELRANDTVRIRIRFDRPGNINLNLKKNHWN